MKSDLCAWRKQNYVVLKEKTFVFSAHSSNRAVRHKNLPQFICTNKNKYGRKKDGKIEEQCQITLDNEHYYCIDHHHIKCDNSNSQRNQINAKRFFFCVDFK